MLAAAAGVFRKLAGPNLHVVQPGRAWRVARGRLRDDALRAIVARHRIRTVIDLRRAASSAADMHRIDFAALGVHFENLHLRASVLAPPEVVARFLDVLQSGEGPFLFICTRGKDKTGFASALFRAVACGDTVARAWASQLTFVPFGHRRETHCGPWRFRALFEASGAADLGRWVREDYPAAYAAANTQDRRVVAPELAPGRIGAA